MSNNYKFFPTVKIHSSKSVSTDDALDFITAYLENAETDDSLNPNAVLTAAGPVATRSGTTGSGSSLTIHNLQRIQAGLRGEHLGPSPKFGMEEELLDDEVVPETPVKKRADKGRKRAAGGEDEGEDWQDPEEFKQQQEEIEGEIDDRMPNVVEGAQAVANSKVVDKSTDKKARKKAKKERRNAEKKDRAKARKSKAEAEA